MILQGVFKLDGHEKQFVTNMKKLSCSSCGKTCKDKDNVYVCSEKKHIFCKCHNERNSPFCPSALEGFNSRYHQDIWCRLVVAK